MNPSEALKLLLEGNQRFVSGEINQLEHVFAARKKVARDQHPFAIVVGCSDSRVSPEILFDQGIGDIFVIRTAGQVVDDIALGSIEYAVEHLHAPLIMVLGHERCGAVSAAVDVEGGQEPGEIETVIKAIQPAIEQSKDQPGDPVDNAVRAQAIMTAEALTTTEPVLTAAIERGQLDITAGRYDLDTGKVVLLYKYGASEPDEAKEIDHPPGKPAPGKPTS